jgi:hypothetical protein
MNHTHCDKCLSKIENGKCDCGIWLEPGETPLFLKLVEKVVLGFDFQVDQGKLPSTFSAYHHSGTAIILFKGDYEFLEKIKDFIFENQNEHK